MTETPEVMILGAGISGLVSASVLLKQGYRNIAVIDEYSHVGGNHIDRQIGDYTFDVGSLIFQDDSPLLAHLPEILPLYVPIKPSWGRLNPQGVVTRYPFSVKDDLIAAGPIEWVMILSSLLYARIFHRKLRNARDFARYWIGAHLLHRSGLENYMKRFYGLPADKIDIKFAASRMLWVKNQAILRNHLHRFFKPSEHVISNTQLARPREGFAHLYEGAVRRLERSGVRFELGARMQGLAKSDGMFTLRTERVDFRSKRVISTIPLARIQLLCGIRSEDTLSTVTLISLFYSFQGNRGFHDSILYNFSHDGCWKRLTVYSDFYGLCDGREFFAVEVNADHVQGSVEIAQRDFRRHAIANRLFVGNLEFEGSHTLSDAYPVYAEGADERAAKMIAMLRDFGVESFGRQGGFEYQPTARQTTLEAEAALSRK